MILNTFTHAYGIFRYIDTHSRHQTGRAADVSKSLHPDTPRSRRQQPPPYDTLSAFARTHQGLLQCGVWHMSGAHYYYYIARIICGCSISNLCPVHPCCVAAGAGYIVVADAKRLFITVRWYLGVFIEECLKMVCKTHINGVVLATWCVRFGSEEKT